MFSLFFFFLILNKLLISVKYETLGHPDYFLIFSLSYPLGFHGKKEYIENFDEDTSEFRNLLPLS